MQAAATEFFDIKTPRSVVTHSSQHAPNNTGQTATFLSCLISILNDFSSLGGFYSFRNYDRTAVRSVRRKMGVTLGVTLGLLVS